jgi:curved DNA-binding protein CbpA
VSDDQDPYRTLGVSPDASDAEIRRAFYARARHAHPDVVGEAGLDDMRALNEAWAILKDPGKRAAHDAAHGHAGPKGGDSGSGSDASAGDGGAATKGGSYEGFGSQPRWTGAAGPPPGRPWGSVLKAGIYAGWSLGEVARRDRGYLAWLRDRPEGKPLRTEIDRLLELTAADSPSPPSGGKRPAKGR